MRFGLEMMANSSRPGATTFGSIGRAGGSVLNFRERDERENRAYGRQLSKEKRKLQLDAAKIQRAAFKDQSDIDIATKRLALSQEVAENNMKNANARTGAYLDSTRNPASVKEYNYMVNNLGMAPDVAASRAFGTGGTSTGGGKTPTAAFKPKDIADMLLQQAQDSGQDPAEIDMQDILTKSTALAQQMNGTQPSAPASTPSPAPSAPKSDAKLS